MTARNTYATLPEFQAYFTARGQTITTNAADDVVIDGLLEQASRFLETKTSRWFYPRIETRYYDLPARGVHYVRDLYFDTDVLEIITFLNGDLTAIDATKYNLLPSNESPRYALQMKVSTTLIWQLDALGDWEGVLALTSYNGYHNHYAADGWKVGGTLGAAITDTTTLAFTASTGHSLAVGQVIKIGNELQIVGTVSSNTITPLSRGDNGSTAATHLISTVVYIWRPMEETRNAVMEIARTAYSRRFGKSSGATETITAAGVVLSPRDIPAMAEEFIKTYQRRY